MKKNIIIPIVFIAISVFFSSCKKDDEGGAPNSNNNGNNNDPCLTTTLSVTAVVDENTITATASGGKTNEPYQFSISTDSSKFSFDKIFSNLAVGTYTIYVKDGDNCVRQTTATILPPPTSFTDPRDNQTYKLVKIGNQTWFAENLNFSIPDSSYCYNNESDSCAKYGRLYTYNAAAEACPVGYRLPSEAEFNTLLTTIKSLGIGTEVEKLIEGGSSGFDALFAGIKNPSAFGQFGNRAVFWTSTRVQSKLDPSVYNAKHLIVKKGLGETEYGDSPPNTVSYSVRCIKD